MTPEGLRWLRHQVKNAVLEASELVRAEARVAGTEAVRGKYALDEWEYKLALDGDLPIETAMRVLKVANDLDAEARAMMNAEVERRR